MVLKYANGSNFTFSSYLTIYNLTWPLTFICDLWTQKLSLVRIGLQLFKLGEFYILSPSNNLTSDDLWPWYMSFDHKTPLVAIRLKLFKWGHFYIFSLSYNLTSHDLWPWYVTFDFINKWGFPCCIYDPTLVEIHQCMWKVEPNVNLFSQQTTATDNNNNRGQSDPYVSFLLRQPTHKRISGAFEGALTLKDGRGWFGSQHPLLMPLLLAIL